MIGWQVHVISLMIGWQVHVISLMIGWQVHVISLMIGWHVHVISLMSGWHVHVISLMSGWHVHVISLMIGWQVHIHCSGFAYLHLQSYLHKKVTHFIWKLILSLNANNIQYSSQCVSCDSTSWLTWAWENSNTVNRCYVVDEKESVDVKQLNVKLTAV